MKLNELMNLTPLLEGKRLEVYESLLPLLLIKEEGEGGGEGGTTDPSGGGGEVVSPQPVDAPVTPAPPTRGDGGWGRGPLSGVGFGGGKWFNEFYKTLKNLIVTTNVLKRMKELGIKPEGQKRVKNAAQKAAQQVNSLLSNPRATAYKIPVWTFDKPKTPKIKRWNEAFAYEFKAELAKLNEQQIED